MTAIGADRVKELRERSGAGIMDCKRALAATAGDLEKAIEFLRKEGVLKAAKKSGRTTLEGLIGVSVSADRKTVSLVEVNCETDFVARTDPFQEFINALSENILQSRPQALNDLMTKKLGGVSVQEALSQLIAKLGENMGIRRFQIVQAGDGEAVGAYCHAGSKIGAAVKLKGKGTEEVAREVAMHVAAMSPHYLDRAQVPPSVIEREKEILRASPDMAGKPENLLDRILEGKINRYFSEVCLVDQPFIKDPTGKRTVGDYVREKVSKGEIVQMIRFQVGGESS